MANYFCKPPRRLIIEGKNNIREFSNWCKLPFIEKTLATASNKLEKNVEPFFKTKGGVSMNLFSYLSHIYKSKNFKSEKEMTQHFLNKPNNQNFLEAKSHAMYGTQMKKVLECIKLQKLQESFKDKFEKMDFKFENKKYATTDKSMIVFRTILMTQKIDEEQFVKAVWDLLNKKYPKKNLLVFRGKPNTGKSMIARSIANLFDYVSTIQGTSSFPFQSLVNVEFGLIEEPNMTLETLQTFKKLAEGVDTEVAVKFKPDQTVQRTPLLITSNDHFDKNAPFAEKRAFDTRYSEFTFFNSADFLIHLKKL